MGGRRRQINSPALDEICACGFDHRLLGRRREMR
jgi:hypothetical protein